MVVWLPQRLKSTFFETFSSLRWLLQSAAAALCSKKFQKTLILAFEAKSALSCVNETKIVKITHSAFGIPRNFYSDNRCLERRSYVNLYQIYVKFMMTILCLLEIYLGLRNIWWPPLLYTLICTHITYELFHKTNVDW